MKKVRKWTDSSILKEAKKYKTKQEMIDSDPALATSLRVKGLYKIATSHMISGRPAMIERMIIHTVENVIEKAKTCKTKSEFRKKFRKEEEALSKRGLINEVYKKVKFFPEDKCSSMGEISTIKYLNKLLGIKLKKTRLDWLGEGRKMIELDGFDKTNKIAFEYNGPYHKNKKVIIMDKFKKKECKKRGIKLLIVIENKRLSKYEFLMDSIKKTSILSN